jgi:hypothetical protein
MVCLNDSKVGGAIHGRPGVTVPARPRVTPAAFLVDRLLLGKILAPGSHVGGLRLIDEPSGRELLAVWVVDAQQRCSDLLFTDNATGQVEPILRDYGRRHGIDVRDPDRVRLHDAKAVLAQLAALGRLPVYSRVRMRVARKLGWRLAAAGYCAALALLFAFHVYLQEDNERLRIEHSQLTEQHLTAEREIAGRMLRSPGHLASAVSDDLIAWVTAARRVHQPGSRVVLRARTRTIRLEVYPLASGTNQNLSGAAGTPDSSLLLHDPTHWSSLGLQRPRLIPAGGSHAAHLEYDLARSDDRLPGLLAP